MPAVVMNPKDLAPKVEAALRKLKRNKDIVSVAYSFDNDWTGDPAVYFRIVLSDEAAREENLMKITPGIKTKLIEELGFFTANLPFIPYFSFRSASEYRESGDRGWR